MGKALDKLVRISETGKISDDADIALVMEHVLKIRAGELSRSIPANNNCMGGFADELYSQGLPTKMLNECTMLELMWLTANSSARHRSRLGEENRSYCLATLRYLLRCNENTLSWVSLFMGLELGAYLRYHDRLRAKKDLPPVAHRMDVYASCVFDGEITGHSTVGQLLKQLEKSAAAPWRPWNDPDTYMRDISSCYTMLEMVLLDCVRPYSGFSKERLIERYANFGTGGAESFGLESQF